MASAWLSLRRSGPVIRAAPPESRPQGDSDAVHSEEARGSTALQIDTVAAALGRSGLFGAVVAYLILNRGRMRENSWRYVSLNITAGCWRVSPVSVRCAAYRVQLHMCNSWRPAAGIAVKGIPLTRAEEARFSSVCPRQVGTRSALGARYLSLC